MDRPSDLIEGAILSGRYELPETVTPNWFRLSPKFPFKVTDESILADRKKFGLCPLQIAVLEMGQSVTAGSTAGTALGGYRKSGGLTRAPRP